MHSVHFMGFSCLPSVILDTVRKCSFGYVRLASKTDESLLGALLIDKIQRLDRTDSEDSCQTTRKRRLAIVFTERVSEGMLSQAVSHVILFQNSACADFLY